MTGHNIIRIPTKWIVIWFSFILFLFILGCLFMNKRVQSLNFLTYNKQMDTTYVVNPHNNRRGLFYDNYEFVVSASSELVENNGGFDKWTMYYKATPSHHTLGDLPGPYYMFKEAYNDTIVVLKDDYLLKFKMPTPDTLSRRERFNREIEEIKEVLGFKN